MHRETASAHLLCCGARAAEDIFEKAYRINIRKALDPLDPGDFDTIVARLSRAMTRAANPTESAALRKAIDGLDVDWPNITAPKRRKIIEASKKALAPVPAKIIPPVTQKLEVSGPLTVKGTRKGVRRGLKATLAAQIGIDMSLRDQRIIDHLVGSQALFVKNEWGARSALFSDMSRRIVADGLDQGLGRDAITDNLNKRLNASLGITRSRNYWNVIAGAFTNRSRTFAQLSSFSEAQIDRFIFEAILDEATTNQCAFLHGKKFSVQRGLDRFDKVEAAKDPEDVKDLQPWIREGRNEDGDKILFTQNRAGERTFVANVAESRVGTQGQGKFSNGISNESLSEMGANTPPLHGLCRSTIVADV